MSAIGDVWVAEMRLFQEIWRWKWLVVEERNFSYEGLYSSGESIVTGVHQERILNRLI